jgi:hypothetical protein
MSVMPGPQLYEGPQRQRQVRKEARPVDVQLRAPSRQRRVQHAQLGPVAVGLGDVVAHVGQVHRDPRDGAVGDLQRTHTRERLERCLRRGGQPLDLGVARAHLGQRGGQAVCVHGVGAGLVVGQLLVQRLDGVLEAPEALRQHLLHVQRELQREVGAAHVVVRLRQRALAVVPGGAHAGLPSAARVDDLAERVERDGALHLDAEDGPPRVAQRQLRVRAVGGGALGAGSHGDSAGDRELEEGRQADLVEPRVGRRDGVIRGAHARVVLRGGLGELQSVCKPVGASLALGHGPRAGQHGEGQAGGEPQRDPGCPHANAAGALRARSAALARCGASRPRLYTGRARLARPRLTPLLRPHPHHHPSCTR